MFNIKLNLAWMTAAELANFACELPSFVECFSVGDTHIFYFDDETDLATFINQIPEELHNV